MRKMIVLGNKNACSRTVLDTVTRKVVTKDFEPLVGAADEASTRINTLNGVVQSMEQLKGKNVVETEKEPTLILTNRMVTDFIFNGTYKYWALNEWKKQDGTVVNAKEVELWEKFAALYLELFTHVCFKQARGFATEDEDDKNTSRYRNYTKNMSVDQKIELDYIDKTWKRVNANVVDTVEEVAGEEI